MGFIDFHKPLMDLIPDDYNVITIECKNFRREGIMPRTVSYKQLVGSDRSRKPMEKEETL